MKKKHNIIILSAAFVVLMLSSASAEVIRLKNGDQISGTVAEMSDEAIIIDTQAMGRVTVLRAHIQEEAVSPVIEEEKPDVEWMKKASLGYSLSGGNTEKSQGTANLQLNRKTQEDEWTLKWDASYSSANKKMDAKKFYGMLRYAYSFGERLGWYHFYKFEGDQDRFANIDYRIVPSTGLGYWFSDKEDFKLMAEGALGYEYTNYRNSDKSDSEIILIPRVFLEKKLLEQLSIKQDIVLYPSLSEAGKYRLHSETSLVNQLTDQLSWRVSFIDDYNSDPSGTAKKNDYRLISAVDYAF